MKEKLLSVVRMAKTKLVTFWSKVRSLKKHFTVKTLSWVVPAVIIVVGLAVLFAVPGPEEADKMASGDENTAAVENALAPASVVGNYGSGLMPAASTPGREFTLALAEDGSASFVGDYKTGRLVDETGTWAREGDRLTITVAKRFGNTLVEPATYTFTVAGDALSLVDYEFSRWGVMGLTLTRNQ